MRRLLLVVLMVLSACSKKDAAIKLVITTVPERPDSCFEVTISSASSAPMTNALPRKSGEHRYEVAIQQGTNLPDDVEFKVQAWVSANGCAEPRWGNGEVTVAGHFTKGTLTTVEAKLDALPDTDGDHTVDSIDCAPLDVTRGQSLAERCNTRLDADCDGVIACDDPDCAARPCVASLAILDGGTVVAGQCASQSLTLLNAGAPEAPSSAVLVVMSSVGDGGVNYFSDSNCSAPATNLSVTTATVPFSFKPTRAGPIMLQVSTASSYLPTQTPYVVTSAAANHCTVSPAWIFTDLETCSQPIEARFFDEFENAAAFAPGITVSPAAATLSNANCAGPIDAAPAASLSFAATSSRPASFVITVDGGTFGCTINGTASHPFPPGALQQWPLVIHTGGRAPEKGYVDYSVMALVDPAIANSDLRAYRWDAGWQALPRFVAPRDASNAEVWFRSQTDFPDDSDNYDYALFSFTDGGANNSQSVFLFTDDFESGNLTRWNVRGSTGWAATGDWTRNNSSFALHHADTGTSTGDEVIEANLADERDVFVEAWWYPDDSGQINVAQMMRLQPGVVTASELNWDVDTWWFNAITASASDRSAGGAMISFPDNQFTRISTAIFGGTMRAWSNGTPIQLGDGGTLVPVQNLDAGHIGFRRWKTDKGLAIDDVMVRRYTEPEPQVTVLSPISAPP